MGITADDVRRLAAECGFELAGIARALPSQDFARFDSWRSSGFAAGMKYLTDHRGDLRSDPRHLLPDAQSMVCVGKLYNTGNEPDRANSDRANPEEGNISRYAWGDHDYHDIIRAGLSQLAAEIAKVHDEPFSWRICVDTAPLLERSYAHAAGLGWIGRNTCLINQGQGSWFFLGELLLSIPLTPGTPPPERCGSCRRCIDACPTDAIVRNAHGEWMIDSGLCISYLTIEERGPIPYGLGPQMGNRIFGCDICQDVCPWNRRAAVTDDERFAPMKISRRLEEFSELGPEEFRTIFRKSPVWRTRYEGFLRNVATAMGNSNSASLLAPLRRLVSHPSQAVSTAASESLAHLREHLEVECASESIP